MKEKIDLNVQIIGSWNAAMIANNPTQGIKCRNMCLTWKKLQMYKKNISITFTGLANARTEIKVFFRTIQFQWVVHYIHTIMEKLSLK